MFVCNIVEKGIFKMKRISLISVFAALLLSAGMVQAADSTKTSATVAPKKLQVQTVDPITGGKLDKKFSLDIQGQRVYFSSASGPTQFRSNADSLFRVAAATGVQFENAQKVCPVSGDKIDKKFSTSWEGRRVYFCCRKCSSIFAKDPMKYLKRFDMPADSVKYDEGIM